MTQEEYIEHEVKLRLHDYNFKRMEAKLNLLIGLVISGWLLPIALHFLKIA